ncbi:MAG: GDP-mannose 4,6-dehydratase [Bacillota bacterium]|nr:GDP-mannose 4,6-dehydratase [Bacillota bacterium]
MKALITGGYGFIGSHVAERFHKEGYEVFIIDNLSTGNKDNVKIRHQSYCIDVTDEKCEEIFRANIFDIVVHFAAQIDVKTSVEKPAYDTKSNILGLVNMLQLSSKFGVKKFIFASSAAAYGDVNEVPISEDSPCEPVSPYGINKFLGEFYCRKWNEIYGLKTVCFRFSNVYGPRQGTKGEGGVISIFVEKLLTKEKLTVFGDGLQTRDFIYVEDLADAIFKAVNSDCAGVFNLSTNTEISLKQLLAVLNKFSEVKEVVYLDQRKGDIERSCLNNGKIKKALNWSPKYSFDEGIEKTINWFRDYNSQNKGSGSNKSGKMTKRLKPIIPYMENIGAFLIVLFLTLSAKKTYFESTGLSIDYKLFYILIFGVAYGIRQALISAALASFILMFTYLSNNNYDFLLFLIKQNNILQILAYIFIGIITGYFAGKNVREINRKNMALKAANEKLELLQRVYDETLNTKNQMLNQIRNSENSLGKIYHMTKKLDSLDLKEIFTSSVELLEDAMKTEEVSIYLLDHEESSLRLEASSKAIERTLPSRIEITESSKYKNIIESKSIYTNKKLKKNLPWMIAPVLYRDKVMALIFIHSMKFENIFTYNENQLQITTDLISMSLTHAWDNMDEPRTA